MRLTRTCNPRHVLLLDVASEAGRRCLKREKVVWSHVLWPESLFYVL